MIIKYKDDIYNRVIVKRLPKLIGVPLDNMITEYKLKKTDRWAAPQIQEIIHDCNCNRPIWVEIETIDRCNGKCGFCPVHAGADQRPFMKMSDKLFEKTINELVDIRFDGVLSLFSNNEPLMDSKIVERTAYAKKMLPNAFHLMYTNGDLLVNNKLEVFAEKFEALANNLNILIIDNYSADNKLTPKIQALYNQYRNEYDNVYIWMRRIDEVFNTRGGHAPNRDKIKSNLKSPCVLAFHYMYIRPDGVVPLCCQDALWKGPKLGDVSKSSIMDVWNGEAYKKLRDHYKNGGRRSELSICKDCDFVTTGKQKSDVWGF